MIVYHSEGDTEGPKRLDAYLAGIWPGRSRSHIQGLIKKGLITVNDMRVKTGYMLKDGDGIELPKEDEPSDISEAPKPKDIPLDIVYEDGDIIVVNKPKGLVVHPAAGHSDDTLVNALMYHCGDSLSGINGELRPGIVHRIDKDTTGLLIACKNDAAHLSLSEQLSSHSIKRRYKALCYGGFKEASGTVDAPIGRRRDDRKRMGVTEGGRMAVTHFQVLESFGDISYIECRLETGRTHQIRVHMSYIRHPLLGDEVYGRSKDPYKGCGQYLHAAVLGFVHPRTGQYMEFEAPLPDYFETTLRRLRADNAAK